MHTQDEAAGTYEEIEKRMQMYDNMLSKLHGMKTQNAKDGKQLKQREEQISVLRKSITAPSAI
jgi:outer membrane lipoprotein-sorting protein